MGQKVTAYFDSDQLSGFEEMQEQGDADSASEAIRVAATTGLQELGYQAGEDHTQSGIARAGEMVGLLAGVVALAWLGVTIAYPVELRIPALGALFASVAAFTVARIADGGGWSVRRRLARLVGGESA